MYQAFYELRELPFDLTPNPRYVVFTPGHREVIANLRYGILGRKGITVLLGEAGTGKTTLVRTVLESDEIRRTHVLYLNNPTLTRAEFVEYLAHGFRLNPEAGASKARFLIELERALDERRRRGMCSALVIDEAQGLSHELLEEIRLLANIETTTEKLLPVVLVGQPELADRLNEPSLRQLKQRVGLRCELTALDLPQTAAYIAERVRLGGGNGASLFTREAVMRIHQRSLGIPRTISIICDNALISGFAAGLRPVDAAVVDEVCRDFDLEPRATETAEASAGARVARGEAAPPVTPQVGPAGPEPLLKATHALSDASADRLFTMLQPRRRLSLFGARGA
jgi:type II secretory pathway predicted ATPase ExeA